MIDFKIRNSVIQEALLTAANLRATANRLQQAAETGDFDALSEVSISSSTWTVDQVRGAATVIARQAADNQQKYEALKHLVKLENAL